MRGLIGVTHEIVGQLRKGLMTSPTQESFVATPIAKAEPRTGRLALTNGRKTPIVGRVMMDCTMVDVTSLPSIRVGDEAVIIGKSGRSEITVADIAELCDSSPYEVVCSLGRRVKRIYTRSGKRVIVPGKQQVHFGKAQTGARFSS